ncbi:uncharacterized protein LOC121386057 [Gigantopelta aegis]|uniref:uncharacterized protein LOC121386057 n=1 Tax=Gigantopelta aegis TaxID=1735272 RepID=UPI001B88770F|nr:uncharacterized protein LOC121386057 [Gigantopelta aegis]
MATAYFSADDVISCCICLGPFTDPRTLPCGHTFCLRCLQRHIDSSVNENTFKCPNCRAVVDIRDQNRPSTSSAEQFPCVVALADALDAIRQLNLRDVPITIAETHPHRYQISSVCKQLKWMGKFLKTSMESEIERLQCGVDMSAVEVADDITRRRGELIRDFIADGNQEQDDVDDYMVTIDKEHDKIKKELNKACISLKIDMFQLFSQHQHFIDESERMINLCERLLNSRSETDIQNNISKLNKIQYIISDFVAQIPSKGKIRDLKLSLTESKKTTVGACSVDIGEIVKSDIKALIEAHRINVDMSAIQIDTQTYGKTDAMTRIQAVIPDTPTSQTDTRTDRRRDSMKRMKTLYTKVSSDRYDPELQSLLVLEGERTKKIVVIDCSNFCVKCFCSETSALRSKYDLSSLPGGLAKLSDQQVLVALPFEQNILDLNIQEDIRLTGTLKTVKPYSYIAVLPGNWLVVSGGWHGQYVDILNVRGHVIQSFPCDLIPHPGCLTVKGDSLIFVSENQIVQCVTLSEHITWQSRDSERLRHPVGVACDIEEFSYVCDDERNCIVQLSRDGEIIRDVITDQDGLSKPWHICYDQDHFYVAQENGDIIIFTWYKASM